MSFLRAVWDWLLSNGGVVATVVAGFLSLFTDAAKSRFRTLLLVGGLLVGAVWSLASDSYKDKVSDAKNEAAIQRMDDYISTQSENTVATVDKNTRVALNEILNQQFGVLPAKASALTPVEARAIADAGTQASSLIQGVSPERRQALTIWVFPHFSTEVDFKVVQTRLSQLAGTVQVHGLQQDTASTNSIWYNRGTVTLDEAKAAALLATSTGISINQICDQTKVQQPNLIQIGGSVAAARQASAGSLPVLSTARIQQLTSPVCAK